MAQLGDDCFYFYSSACHRGSVCLYRHQPAAKNTFETCKDWLKGSCINKVCALRHAVISSKDHPVISSKGNIKCRYESTGGCLDPNCPFMHVNKIPQIQASITQVAKPLPLTSHNTIKPVIPTQLQPLTEVQNNNTPVIANGFVPTLQPNILRVREVLPPQQNILQVPQILPRPVLTMPSLPRPVPGLPQQPVPSQPQHKQMSILGAPPTNPFPKNERFTEQVRLFKEMLATQKSRKEIQDDAAESEEEDEEIHGSGKYKYKEKQKSKRNRRNDRDGHKSSKNHHKKNKIGFNKGDEEILYGDYKDVKIEKKRKKKHERHTDSDSDISVKSYEEILREKALRKLMERKREKREKEKFNEIFEELLNEEELVKPKKLYKHDPEKLSSKKHQKSDLKDEAYSKEDAIELGLNASPIREEKERTPDETDKKLTDSKKDPEKHSETPINSPQYNPDSSVDAEADSSAVLVFPDETTDINFSVDADDDLIQELNELPEEKVSVKKKSIITDQNSRTRSRVKDKTNIKSSRRSRSEERNSVNKTGRQEPKSKKSRLVSSIVSVVKKSHLSPTKVKPPSQKKIEKEKLLQSPKKVIRLTTESKLSHKHDDSPVAFSEKEATHETIDISLPKKTEEIKIKPFNEVIAEKRKRALANKTNREVVIIPDDSDNNTAKRNSTLTKTAGQSRTVRSLPAKQRANLTGSSEEDTLKRKSIKLYQPPLISHSDVGNPISQQQQPEKKIAAIVGGRKVIKLRNPLSSDIIDEPTVPDRSTVTTKTEEKKNINSSSGTVLSFEEIMRAKRLRKQKANQITSNSVKESTNEATNTSSRNTFIKRSRIIKRSLVSTKPINMTSSKDTSQSVTKGVTLTDTSNADTHPTKTALGVTSVTNLHTINSTNSVDITSVKRVTSPSVPIIPVAANKVTIETKLAIISPSHVVPIKRSSFSDSFSEDILLGSEPSTPIENLTTTEFSAHVDKSLDNTPRNSPPGVVPRLSTSPNVSLNGKIQIPNSDVLETADESKDVTDAPPSPTETPNHSPHSIEDIQEALDEEKRKREQDLLSDDEFEKELNDLCSGDDDDTAYDDIDEDDLMMELEQMIDS